MTKSFDILGFNHLFEIIMSNRKSGLLHPLLRRLNENTRTAYISQSEIDRINTLKKEVETAYEENRHADAERLDAELEELLDYMEHKLEQMEEEGLNTDPITAMNSNHIAVGSDMPDEGAIDITSDMANRWNSLQREFTREHPYGIDNSGNPRKKEDLAKFLHSTLDDYLTQSEPYDNLTPDQIIDAFKDAYERKISLLSKYGYSTQEPGPIENDEIVRYTDRKGIGIYEAVKQQFSPYKWKTFIEHLKSKWSLKNPGEYMNAKAYFTKTGNNLFLKLHMPYLRAHVRPIPHVIKKPSTKPIYEDQNQVIYSNGTI